MADIDITPGSKSSANKTPGIKPSDTSDRTDPISGGGGDVSFEGDYTPRITPKPGPDIDWTVIPDPDTGKDSGTPGEPIPDPVEPTYNPGVEYTRTEYIYSAISDFSQDALQDMENAGYMPILVMDDGTEVEVSWEDVHDTAVTPESVLFDWSYADGLVDDVKNDIAEYKQTAAATYSTKTDLDEATGALSREVAVTYATKDENEASTHPNLSPFFAHDLNDYANYVTNTVDSDWTNNDAYFLMKKTSGGWEGTSLYDFSLDQLDDGWAHVYMHNNNTSADRRFDFHITQPTGLKEDTIYTFLMEFRNNNSINSANSTNFYIVQNGENYGQNCWFWGAGINELLEGTNTIGGVNLTKEFPAGTSGVYRKRFTKKTEKTGSTRWKGTHPRTLASLVFLLGAGDTSLDFDIRVSMYEGKYMGIYKPYVPQESKLATKSLLSQTAEAITASVETKFSDVQTQFDDIDSSMEAMQGQLDGLTNIWYGTVSPTTSNYPASQWNTDALKAEHNGDLYFNSENGNAWRWLKDGNTWKWVAIPAGEAQEALNKAQEALDDLVEVKRDYVTKAEQTITDDAIRQSVSDNLETAKTYASGLVNTEVVNRDAAITTMANTIKMEVGEEYAKKSIGNPNIAPFFSHTPYAVDDYWTNITNAQWFTYVDDGWLSFNCPTSTSSARYANMFITPSDRIKPSTTYTMLVEFDEVTYTGTGNVGILVSSQTASQIPAKAYYKTDLAGAQRYVFTTESDLSKKTMLCRMYFSIPANCTLACKIRISLFEGEYQGLYKPYVTDQTELQDKYSTKAELAVQADRITSSVEATKSILKDGVNLLVGTEKPQWTGKKTNQQSAYPDATNPTFWGAYGARTNTVSRSDTSIKLEQGSSSGNSGFVIPLQYDGAVVKLGTYTLTCKYRTNMPNTGSIWLLMRAGGNYTANPAVTLENDGEWHDFALTFTNNYTGTSEPYALLFGWRSVTNEYLEIQDASMSLVRGDQATATSMKSLSTTVTQTATDVQTAITQSSNAIDTANSAIKSVSVEYAQNQNATTAPTTGWSTTAPTWKNGYYIWSRTATTTSNGTTYSTATNISGSKGSDGTNGIGVKAVVEEYYLSTSSTAQSGGSWSTNQPAWAANKYIWTRSKVTWSDDSTTTTTPVLAQAINGANSTANTANTLATTVSTMIRQYGQGVLVARTSEKIGALVNADASFDVVPVTWSGTGASATPTADTTNSHATFGTTTRIGKSSAKNIQLSSTNISFYDGTTQAGFITATTAQLGAATAKNVQLTTAGLYLRDSTTNLAAFTPTAVTLGKSDNYNVNLSAGTTGAGLYLRNSSTNLAQFTTTAITLGETGTSTAPKKNVVINTDGVYLRYYTTNMASFTNSSLILGNSSMFSIKINTTDSDQSIEFYKSTEKRMRIDTDNLSYFMYLSNSSSSAFKAWHPFVQIGSFKEMFPKTTITKETMFNGLYVGLDSSKSTTWSSDTFRTVVNSTGLYFYNMNDDDNPKAWVGCTNGKLNWTSIAFSTINTRYSDNGISNFNDLPFNINVFPGASGESSGASNRLIVEKNVTKIPNLLDRAFVKLITRTGIPLSGSTSNSGLPLGASNMNMTTSNVMEVNTSNKTLVTLKKDCYYYVLVKIYTPYVSSGSCSFTLKRVTTPPTGSATTTTTNITKWNGTTIFDGSTNGIISGTAGTTIDFTYSFKATNFPSSKVYVEIDIVTKTRMTYS